MLPVAAPISGLRVNAAAMLRMLSGASTTSLSMLMTISPEEASMPALSAWALPAWPFLMSASVPPNGPTWMARPRSM